MSRTGVFKIKVMTAALAAAFAGGALANPVKPVVASGQAVFQQNGKTLTVTNTPSAIINWQSFNIDRGELTRFIQQSATSQVLREIVITDIPVIMFSYRMNGGDAHEDNDTGTQWRVRRIGGTNLAFG